MLLVGKLTFRSAADLQKSIKGIEDDVAQLKKDSWTTEQRVNLEGRLVKAELQLDHIVEEVDFTRASHKEFLRLLEKAWIPVAHSPHTPELDALLEKRDRDEELSTAEWKELIRQLKAQADDYNNQPGKKLAIRGLLAIYLAQLRAAQRREGLTT